MLTKLGVLLVHQTIASAIIFFLVGCGPSSSSDGSNGDGDGDHSNNNNADYCAENYPSSVSNVGNVYMFDTTSPDCLGLVESPALRKEIPFSITLIDADDLVSPDPELSYDATIKLLLRQSGINFGGFDVYASVKMTNDSSEYYCYRPDDIELKNASGDVLIDNLDSPSNTGGALFHSTGVTNFRCLPPGQTHYFFTYALQVTVDTFNAISSATMDEIKLEQESGSYRQAPTLTAEMTWLNPGTYGLGYPSLEVTWTNTTGETVKLDDDFHNVLFMDAEGYVVSQSFVRLHEGLNIDESELQPDDFIVVNGGTVTLTDDIADNAAVTPSSATRALIYLHWVRVD